jgi:hypothetical protein
MRKTLKPLNMNNIREYYLQNFPADELGIEINENATFDGLVIVLNNYGDVYQYIGVDDSLMRERLFWELSQLTGTPYDDVYYLWLMAS